ncbi:MAG: hypothetical protein JXQ80_02615 [Bacteroidales bacterium]|nr:hypothetical protein [Bacteroidales bacterium]
MKKTVLPRYMILLTVMVLTLLSACRKDPFRADISNIHTQIQITRFEEMLFTADPSEIEVYIPQWKEELGVFFYHYCYILKLGNPDDPAFPDRMRDFVTQRHHYQLYTRTMQVFPDLKELTTELNSAFSYYRYYFPDKEIPQIITYLSGFNQSAITDDSLLAIGLDKYLGAEEPLYRQIGIYSYLTVNMHPLKIASDALSFWAETEFPYNDSVNNLIANMIYRGRLLYFTNAMLPHQPDSLRWGFTASDLAFFSSAEKHMWAYLVQEKLLFNTDRFTIDKFVLEGPFTKDFGRGSPARAAVWIGYRIVSNYMNRNSGLTLEQLMAETDYLKILNQSGYNP